MHKKNKKHWFLYILACLFISGGVFFALISGQLTSVEPNAFFSIPELIRPDEAIEVLFDQSVNPSVIEESLKITPPVEGKIDWSPDYKSFCFVPSEVLEPGEKYMVAFYGQNSKRAPFEGKKEVKVISAPSVHSYEPLETQGVGKYSKIFVKLDQPSGNYFFDFKFTPEIPFDVAINDIKDEFQLMPREALKDDTTYIVEVFRRWQTSGMHSEQVKIKEFSFSTLKPPLLLSSSPRNKAAEVLIKQKITLTFSKPIDLGSFSNYFQLVPDVKFTVSANPAGNVIMVQPQEYAEDTEYQAIIQKGLEAQDGSYFDSDQAIAFKTGNAQGIVYERRAALEPAISEGKYIDANLSKQLLDVYQDGNLIATYKISSGKRGMATPTGQYSVQRKELRHWSHKYKLWMPYSMQFTGEGHFIHELPEWPSGYKEGAAHLGIPVSHGCIRLGVGSAKSVFEFAEVGTPIVIHY